MRASRSSGVTGDGQQHGLDAGVLGGPLPVGQLLQRQVGDDGAGHARLDQRAGEAPVPVVEDEVVVGHRHQRHADVDAGVSEDAGRRGAAVERALRRLLDGGAVHHRVGERDADLDGVGAGRGHGPHHVEPVGREAAGDVGHEQLAPGVTRRPQARAPQAAHRSQVEQLHHLLGVLVAPARQGDQHRRARRELAVPAARATQARAWAGSRAGMMPSVRASSWKASSTSASPAGT